MTIFHTKCKQDRKLYAATISIHINICCMQHLSKWSSEWYISRRIENACLTLQYLTHMQVLLRRSCYIVRQCKVHHCLSRNSWSVMFSSPTSTRERPFSVTEKSLHESDRGFDNDGHKQRLWPPQPWRPQPWQPTKDITWWIMSNAVMNLAIS